MLQKSSRISAQRFRAIVILENLELVISVFSYLDEIERLCDVNYKPTQQDVLYTRVKTTGIIETEFKCREFTFK